jgi:hypothetical protein
MNAKNLSCWVTAITLYVCLTLWAGSQPPASAPPGRNSTWSKLLRASQHVAPSASTSVNVPVRPAPAPPPEPLSRERAERLLAASAVKDYGLQERLVRSIRVSPLPLDSVDELERGASRIAGLPDVPAGFTWPKFNGDPLTMVAQIELSEVAELDEDELLPKTGWLCFFHACASDPPASGRDPAETGAARVVYFDEPVDELQRVSPPGGAKEVFAPCALRFWQEWTLPSPQEEPGLIGDDSGGYYYLDICDALTGRPKEPGWHHLLGEAQNVGGPMRPVCELVSKGVAVTESTDLREPKLKARLSKANEWVLLLQLELGSLERLEQPAEPDQASSGDDQPPPDAGPFPPRAGGLRPSDSAARAFWLGLAGPERLYYWIRAKELKAHDFSHAWAILQ